MIYVENLKESTKKNLLELISDYSKVTEYMINTKRNKSIIPINKWNLKLKTKYIYITTPQN